MWSWFLWHTWMEPWAGVYWMHGASRHHCWETGHRRNCFYEPVAFKGTFCPTFQLTLFTVAQQSIKYITWLRVCELANFTHMGFSVWPVWHFLAKVKLKNNIYPWRCCSGGILFFTCLCPESPLQDCDFLGKEYFLVSTSDTTSTKCFILSTDRRPVPFAGFFSNKRSQ